MNSRRAYFWGFIFLFIFLVLGNYKVIQSHLSYIHYLEIDQKNLLKATSNYFDSQSTLSKEKALQLISLAAERELDMQYIKPLYYAFLFTYNLLFFILVAVNFKAMRKGGKF